MTTLAAVDLTAYIPVFVILLMAIAFVVATIIASSLIGPQAQGVVKGIPVESGMDPIGSTKKRFNVRFYMLAMTFLVFDVEIIFLYPWAVTFTQLTPAAPESVMFLGRILFFVATGIAAYIYAWRKGVFRWD